MKYSPITLARRNVLGDLNSRCEQVAGSLPVYLGSRDGLMLGRCDESLGRYSDAFVFHLSEEVCKKLSTNGYEFTVHYERIRTKAASQPGARNYKLTYIVLTERTAAVVVKPQIKPVA